MMKEKELSLKR